MATLNYAFKEISCKIVYYGCGLCGKTTNLIHVHKTVPNKFRGELVSLATEQDRTLFFDFLPLDLGEVRGFKTKFQLYTVPGQVYYNATRKLVLRGVDGLVFVADSQKDRLQENVESFNNLVENLQEYGYTLKKDENDHEGIPWILQLNKRDMPQISEKEEMLDALGVSQSIPCIDAVAVNGTGVRETLKGISSLVIKKLNSSGGALAGSSTPATAGNTPKPEASAPAAQPKSNPAPAASKGDEFAAGKEEKKAAPPKMPEPVPEPEPEPTPDPIQAVQSCDGLWRGMKTGSGSLNMNQIEDKEEFELTGTVSFTLGKRTFSQKLDVTGKEEKTVDGVAKEYWSLQTQAGQSPQVSGFLSPDDNLFFLQYKGFGGKIQILPVGKSEFPK